MDVDKTDLVKAVRGLEADPGKASKLRKGAKRVEYAFTTPESLADYLIKKSAHGEAVESTIS